MGPQQRLIVCLDGTWNQQDSSTNILHHFNIVHEGLDPKGLYQRRYYHRGVGTGVLDSITGGGFGFGLEQNVRDAYNWLVQHYCDREPDGPPDEIYVFGFSRGAYTARSLVGFIGRCGLLRRGAPVTVGQLWDDYCILGRQAEERHTVWDTIFWQPEARIRQLTELQHGENLNPAERLLRRWSRRVNITYLGIYDTVGAIGWDALAIPGLTSRMALHNNLRPTTLIQHCRHALALDEHRSSFNHTPFLAYIGNNERELERGGAAGGGSQGYWDRNIEMWKSRIEQRWFVGAHSNVGGGYEDNLLAERPFQWIVEGATNLGLAAESVAWDCPPTHADQIPRDSYAEFAPPLWTKILRAKPNYRAICPDAASIASARSSRKGVAAAGFSLRTINETLDETVAAYYRDTQLPLPPNLEDYVTRKGASIPGCERAGHRWLSDTVSDPVWVVVWASLAAAGLFAVDQLIGKEPSGAGQIAATAIALLLPLIDWSESRVNFEYARGWKGPFPRAFLDAIYWMRAFGFVLAVFGLTHVTMLLVPMGWRHGGWTELTQFAGDYWPVPLCAAVTTAAAGKLRPKALLGALLGPLAAAATGGVLFGAGWLAHTLFPELRDGLKPVIPTALSMPGLLLALQLALVYVGRARNWTAEPMAKANLGSVVRLQTCVTPNQVAECLESWRARLVCAWDSKDNDFTNGPAAKQMRKLLGEVLYRDMIGFIPVYSLVLFFGLWFGHRYVSPWRDGLFALWWLLPVLAAATDYLEDACHFRYRSLHEHGQTPSAALTLFSCSMSWIKFAAFGLALILTLGAVLGGTWQLKSLLSDWRAKIALLISVAGIGSVLLAIVARAVHFTRLRARRRHHKGQRAAAAAR
jgi:uncharacterized protein (DUF2235 family)